jgi:hypothetical protein
MVLVLVLMLKYLVYFHLQQPNCWRTDKVKVNRRFIWRLKKQSSKVARANRWEQTCFSNSGARLSKPHASHRTAVRLHSQPSTAGTRCILIATNLPTPEGWTAWLAAPALGFETFSRCPLKSLMND